MGKQQGCPVPLVPALKQHGTAQAKQGKMDELSMGQASTHAFDIAIGLCLGLGFLLSF